MGPLDHLDVTAEELAELVAGEAWDRWLRAEPSLAVLGSLPDLRHRRGREADQLLGALVRLAAKDGGDDELAARAVVHQVGFDAQRIAYDLRDLGPDVDAIVLASLWIEIRTFPWRRRTRAYATSLRHATRRSALWHLLFKESDRKLVQLRPPEQITDIARVAVPGEPAGLTGTESRQELVEYLNWCLGTGWITDDDATLMLELVLAGWETAEAGVLRLRRGACSMYAIEVVASRRGVSGKTIVRERDRVLTLLRAAVVDYLRDVA